VRVEQATEVSDGLVEEIGALVRQLSSSAPAPSFEELQEIVFAPATRLLLARDDGGRVVGTLTLALFRIPTGMRAWIEDVVVDEAARGQGVGQALTDAMIDRARERGCVTVDLTSRPSREAANRLYQRIGFVARETNVYRYDLRK
jgi:ribosomal protein S18 acetylase RimI-like enzyme